MSTSREPRSSPRRRAGGADGDGGSRAPDREPTTDRDAPSPDRAPAARTDGPPARDDRGPPRRDDRGPPRRDDRGPPRRDDRGPPRRDDRGPPRRDDRGGVADGRARRQRDEHAGPADRGPPVLRAIVKVRTPHGTRVARRITCTACGKDDTIDFAPKTPADALCRKCALEKRGVVDPDDAAVRTLRVQCVDCKRFFERVLDVQRPGPPVCTDCKNGVETQQQDRAKLATRVSAKIVRARRTRPGDED